MLKFLNIENIAVIEKMSVEFSEGLNVLTGETGAGKSVLIDSINAVTGEKASRELIRSGEKSAEVSALFDAAAAQVQEKLSEFGIECEPDGSLLLQRRMMADGKNLCRINGSPVTVSILKAIGGELINIHGQRDSQSLLNSSRHIGFVDSFAGTELQAAELRQGYKALSELLTHIKSLQTDEEYKQRKTELLTFQIQELEDAQIKDGERTRLKKKKKLIDDSLKLNLALNNAISALSGDAESAGAASLLSFAAASIRPFSEVAQGIAEISASIESAADTVADAVGVMQDALGETAGLEAERDAVEERLDKLFRLSEKYGAQESDMLQYLENAKAQLNEITSADELMKTLSAEYEEKLRVLSEKAAKLSEKRKAAGVRLSERIEGELSFLNMAGCRFICSFSEAPLGANGIDCVEFMLSANPGEEPKPLNKIASGGELSRIMLAMKNVLTKIGGADTLIFDEIDTGVSGSAAGKIALKLFEVSCGTQTLCITHLAQIAAFADRHIFLSKSSSGGKTRTSAQLLDRDQRAAELARITFGAHISEVQKNSAEQMLSDAEKIKSEQK